MALQKNLTFALLGEDKTASSTMTRAQEVAEKTTGRIGGAFASLGSKLGGEFGEVLSMTGEGIAQVGEHTGKLAAGIGIAGGVITGAGVALQQMGSGNKQAADQLQQAIKNSGHSYSDYREEIEKTISKNEDLGHSDDDTQQALQRMTQAFGDPNKALKQMALVSDLAAAKHISLADASDQVIKIVGGKGAKTLTQFGIEMGKSGNKTKDTQDALDKLGSKLSGQASASVDNFAGKVAGVRTHLGDWAADMANQVGPVLTAVGPILLTASAAMEIYKSANIGLRLVQLGQAIATGVSTAAQWAFNAAMDANPIMIVVLAVAALVAGLVWFFTQTKLGQTIWKNFTSFIATSWNWLWNSVLKPVFGFIGAIFGWLYKNVIIPIGAGIALQFRVLGAAFTWLWNSVISPVATWIGGAIHTIGSVVGSVFGAIGGTIRGAFNGVVSFIRGAINGIIDVINGATGGINTLINGINSVPGVHIGLIPRIPHLALGGIVDRPTVALLGESGPEEIRPLRGTGVSRGGGVTIQVDVHVPSGFVGNARELSNMLINGIRSGVVNAPELKHALGA